MKALLLVVVSLVVLGCATVEPVHRPPTPSEIAKLNDVGRESGPLVIDLLPHVDACVGRACSRPSAPKELPFDHIAHADERTLELVPPSGPPLSLPLEEVVGVSAHRGGRGAAIGAGIGAGVALVEILGIVAAGALLGGAPSDPGAQQPSGCDSKCAEFILGFSTLLVGGGALIGAVVGSPRHYPFNLGPATNP